MNSISLLMTQLSRFPIYPLILLPPVPQTDHNFLLFPHLRFSSSLFTPTQFLKCLKLPCLVRQQLEEICLKQEQQETSGNKRRKETRDQNQGESAGEKSRPSARLRGLSTHLAHRSRNRGREVSRVLLLPSFCRKMGWYC